MKFCPNCGFKLPGEGLKFCPECGARLPVAADAQPAASAQTAPAPGPAAAAPQGTAPSASTILTGPQSQEKAFELLKSEVSRTASELSRDIAENLLEKWKASGKFPQRLGGVVDILAKKGLPLAIQSAVLSAAWQNGQVKEISGGLLDTSITTSFPLKVETGIPLFGKVSLEKVNLTMKGNVNVAAGAVTGVQVGAISVA